MASVDACARNIELKAVDHERERTLRACLALKAEDHGVIWQRDTYFNVNVGGLKLREERPGSPHLIHFRRANQPQERESRYRIIAVAEPEALAKLLAAALGVRAVVEKHRHLFLWQGVRIHLDDVEGLGAFIELEAVAAPASDLTREHELVTELRQVFTITDDRLCARGYAQQLLERL